MGWGRGLEPAAFSRPETMVVRIGKGVLELASRLDWQDLVWGWKGGRGTSQGLTPITFNLRSLC